MLWSTQMLQFPFLAPLMVFFVNLIVLILILHFVGLAVVGGEKTKISRAFAIAFLGAFVNFVLTLLFILLPISVVFSWEYTLIFRVFLSIVVLLALIRSFYKTRWLGAIAVAVLVLVMLVLELFVKDFLLSLKIVLILQLL